MPGTLLNTKQSLIYTGLSKVTFLKYKIPKIRSGKKNMYSTFDIDLYVNDRTMPKFLPSEPSHTAIVQLEEEIDGLDVLVAGQKLFDELSLEFHNTGDMTAYEVSKISSLTVVRLAISKIETVIVNDPLNTDYGSLHQKYLRSEEIILKELRYKTQPKHHKHAGKIHP